jgi:diguanylate cyclase (GGDEF)-like protein
MKKNRILVIDDDPAIRELLRVNLENSGNAVVLASDGEEALVQIESGRFDLIILDIMLPKVDGYEICQRLRKKEVTLLTPLIIISAKDKPVDKVTGLKLGANDYVTKPFNLDELMARVDALLVNTGRILSANPLTKLPGNISIMQEVNRRLVNNEKFAFIYIDIDNFKTFNDRYGFVRGDEIIKFTAGAIEKCVKDNDFVGHVGGDDFIILCRVGDAEPLCSSIIRLFDTGVSEFYDAEDRKKGFITSTDRSGQVQNFSVMTLSIAIVTNERNDLNHYGKIVDVAAEVKKYAKLKTKGPGSNFIVDRRKEPLDGGVM